MNRTAMSDSFVKIYIEDSSVLYLNTDGTYVLNNMPFDETKNDSVLLSKDNSCLLQCYSNGYVNKTSITEILRLRKGFTYSHGLFTGSNLQYCNVSTNDDFIIALFEKDGKKYVTIKSVAPITLHSMLGLKGDYFVKTTFDVIYNWSILSNEHSVNIPKIIAICLRTGYLSIDNSECSDELLWLDSNVFKLKDVPAQDLEQTTIPQKSEDDGNNVDFSSLIGKENEASLRETFSGYLKSGRNIPVGQGHVRDLLSVCRCKEDFWLTVKCLLDCNMKVYRSPIVAYFQNNPYALYNPDHDTLDSIIKLIFATDEKVEKNLEFLYPFRTLLTGDMLSFIKSKINGMSSPKDYHLFGEIFNYSSEDLIEYCLEHITPASYYCIYEVIQKLSKKEGMTSARKMVGSISNRIDDKLIEGKLIKNLLNYEFRLKIKVLSADLVMIKSAGFDEFIRICRSSEGKKKHKELIDNISSFVGQQVEARYVATYQNHYYLRIKPGLRVLLPKKMATGVPSADAITSVYIVMAERNYDTLYATQKFPADYKRITQIPLLNNGDIIEVTFDINGKPEPHKCYKKIKLAIKSYPKDFDSRARYKARVIRQVSDKYHYLVNLIQHI